MSFYCAILEKVILPAGDLLVGTSFIQNLRKQRKAQFYSRKELEQIQQHKIEELLLFAKENYAFYNSIETSKDKLQEIPILTKDRLRTLVSSFDEKKRNSSIKISTSGSTGDRTTVYFNKDEISIPRAIQTLWWEWAGYKLGNSIFQIGANPKRTVLKRIKDIVFRTKYISVLGHTEVDLENELANLVKNPKEHLFGFSSSMEIFADIAMSKNLKVHFKSVSNFGEKFFNYQVEKVESTFNTRAFDTYGCAEGLLIAGTCEFGNYHIMNTHVFLEVVDENDNEVDEGEVGRAIVTGLDNFTTPLIRYENGDLVRKVSPTKKCKCNRQMPLLGEVFGRSAELIRTEKSQYITVQTLTGIMKKIEGVDRFQFIQKSINNFSIKITKSSIYSDNTNQDIKRSFDSLITESFQLEIIIVEEIQLEKSGKFKFVIIEK